MAYFVAFAEHRDLATIRARSPETWRRVRRYNLPVQLALAAAQDVMTASTDPKSVVVISLAPCQPGSAELYRWGDVVTSRMLNGTLGDLRMNPTQTLHAVDNLAMSAFAITFGNHADCLGLGGAAGQAWSGLEAVIERIEDGAEEVLLMAGDQDQASEVAEGVGIALLFSKRARPFAPCERPVRLVRIERHPMDRSSGVIPHAANGLSDLVSAVASHQSSSIAHEVPPQHTDGHSSVTVVLETCS
ncbi:MAG TPA: hypothetical protein VNO50_21905 [Pyrinomonadaceae bacterium]|nr:hypothetical protein [Pyrinomonadaceae bacterium]